jgi:L-ascorbate metabolism protein UlaG (beta-lactamase superfamily)
MAAAAGRASVDFMCTLTDSVSAMSNHDRLTLTRVANSCVLIELNGQAVLTDPWFTERWYLKRGEPLGLGLDQLPPLAAIVVTSFAANHWDMRALRQYAYKAETPVFVSANLMIRQSRRMGFQNVIRMHWDESRDLGPDLSVEAVPAGRTLVWRNNAYVFSSGGLRVFFGGEIEDVALVERHRARRGPAQVALLPTNGLRPLLGPPLVMEHRKAVAGAEALGAQVLVPVHDAHADDPMSLIFRRHGSAAEAKELAASRSTGLDVVCLDPGTRWTYQPAAAR